MRWGALAVIVGSVVLVAVVGRLARAEPVELTLHYNLGNADQIRAGLEALEARQPDIDVTLEQIAFRDARDQFIREAAVGGGPDIVHLAFVWVKDLGDSGACLALDDLIAKEGIGEAGFGDFVATDLMRNQDGHIVGVPFSTDTFAMVYQTDVMAEAGIEAVPETWDQLLDDARKVKAETGKVGFGFAAGASAANTIWFLANYYWWSNDAALVVDDGQGGFTTGITAEQIADAITYYGTYLEEDLTTAGSLGIDAWNAPEVLEPMLAGEQWAVMVPVFTAVQMFDDWRSRHPGEELPFTTAMIPRGSAPSMAHLGGHAFCINAGTGHPEAAFAVLQDLNSAAFFEAYNPDYYPAQHALLAEQPFPPELAGFRDQLDHGARSWGAYARGPANIASLWNQTSRSFGAAFIGQQTPLEAGQELLDFVLGQLGS